MVNVVDPNIVSINESLQRAGIPVTVSLSDQMAGTLNAVSIGSITSEDMKKLDNFFVNITNIYGYHVNRQF